MNVELSRLDAERDLALAAYNESVSHNAEEQYDPYYRTVPVVTVPCPNRCGANFTSIDSGGLRNLADYLYTKHRSSCGSQDNTVAGCGVNHWTCDGINKSGKELHSVRYCGKDIKYYERADYLFPKSLGVCGAPYRACSVTEGTHKYNADYKYNSSSRGYYIAGYSEYTPLFPNKKHGDGTLAAPSISINGPNGVGISSVIPDATPNCSTCLDGSKHCPGCGSTENNGQAQNSPPPSTPSPPAMHACGVHAATVSGTHSLQASCSKTDSHGQSCTVTGFYACASHKCVFPAVDTTPNCSNCTDGCSSCPVSCASGHSYDPSNSGENNMHRTRTCRWCTQTWQKCVSGAPQCLVKTNRTCWATE